MYTRHISIALYFGLKTLEGFVEDLILGLFLEFKI